MVAKPSSVNFRIRRTPRAKPILLYCHRLSRRYRLPTSSTDDIVHRPHRLPPSYIRSFATTRRVLRDTQIITHTQVTGPASLHTRLGRRGLVEAYTAGFYARTSLLGLLSLTGGR